MGTTPDERRAKVRAYKETLRPMGVFRVRDTQSGAYFLGSSTDLPSMLNRQLFQLESGVHPDRLLQKRFDESGPTAFAFEVLDTLEHPDTPGYDPSDDLAELLSMWRERLA